MAANTHKNRSHAILSASGASRWIACPPSARLELKFEDTTSEAASEGTLAHELCELILKLKLGRIARKIYAEELAAIKKSPLYDRSMQNHCDDFADYVMERFSEAQAKCKDAIIILEHRFDLRNYIPEGFGTGDVVIICDAFILIIDLKFGKGVAVDAHENTQMKIYALGAADDYETIYDFENVEMVIHQPRLSGASSYKMPLEKLKAWGKRILIPAAKTAFSGKGEFEAGTHCMFCRAKAQCKALAAYANELARLEFADPDLLTKAEIAEVIEKKPVIVNWLNAVDEYALLQALNHRAKWPGFKLVAGRSNRVYTDPAAIIEKLTSIGFKWADVVTLPELLGVTALTKVIGEKDFNAHLTPYITKQDGKPTLVPLSDKRQSLNPNDKARKDFADDL